MKVYVVIATTGIEPVIFGVYTDQSVAEEKENEIQAAGASSDTVVHTMIHASELVEPDLSDVCKMHGALVQASRYADKIREDNPVLNNWWINSQLDDMMNELVDIIKPEGI